MLQTLTQQRSSFFSKWTSVGGSDAPVCCAGTDLAPLADIRDLVSVQDVMEELDFGPNGGLIYAMEFLTKNLDWLEEELETFGDDDYLILDCPGQIELYTHIPVMPAIVGALHAEGFNVCGVHLVRARSRCCHPARAKVLPGRWTQCLRPMLRSCWLAH